MKKVLATLLLVLPTAALAAPGDATGGQQAAETNVGAEAVVWHRSVAEASRQDEALFRPTFLLFSSPTCSWCRRFRSEVLEHPGVLPMLAHLSLVELDIDENRSLADHYLVRVVPTSVLLSADGQVRTRIEGYVERAPLRKTLTQLLGQAAPVFGRQQELEDLLTVLAESELPDNKWPELVLFLREPQFRSTVRAALEAAGPDARRRLVSLLRHPALPVRLGSLEMLEELSGETFGFDPWFDGAETNADQPAFAQWQAWSEAAPDTTPQAFSALTREQVRDYLTDLLHGDGEPARRARRMLLQAGASTASVLAEIVEATPDMPPGTRRAIRELRYALLLPAVAGVDPAVLAHRLVLGNLDVRLQAVRDLQRTGAPAVPVLRDLLADREPLVREAAVDALVSV